VQQAWCLLGGGRRERSKKLDVVLRHAETGEQIAKALPENEKRLRAVPVVRIGLIEIDLGNGRRVRVDSQVDADPRDDIPAATQPKLRRGEADFMQGVADIKDLGGLSAEALSGAFDEPLSKGKVLVITKMFIRATY
jgi:hypothetical protein